VHIESKTHKTLRNSVWGVLGYLVPISIAIFVTPIIIFGIGDHNYGVYIFLISVIGILGVIDLGIATAVTRQIAEYHSQNNSVELKKTFGSALSIGFIIGTIGLLVCIILGIGGHTLLAGSTAPHVALFYVIIGFIFFLNLASMPYMIIPSALQRFDISTKISIILSIVTAFASILVVKTGYGIMGLVLVQLGSSILIAIISVIYAKKILPEIVSMRLTWSKNTVKKLYSFSLKAFMASVGNTSSTYLGRLIIPIFLGPAALTYYSVPGGVAVKIPGMVGALSGILFPLTASLSAANEHEKIKIIYVRSFRLITILATAAASSIIFFAEPILRYWLNQEFATRSLNVLILLTLTNFILAIYTPLNNFLLGIGKLKMITVVSFTMGIMNAIFLLLFLQKFNIDGVAWAYLLSTLPIAYAIRHTEKKYLNISGRKNYYLGLAFKTLVTVAVSYFVSMFVWIPLTTSFTIMLFTGPASVLTYLALYKLFGFYEKEDWRDLSIFARSAIKKFK